MRKNSLFWLVALSCLVIDQLTKYWVVQSFPNPGDSFPLWAGVFHLTYIVNTGAAFSLFPGGVVWLRWLSLIVSVGLISFALVGPKLKRLEQLACSLILAGALGNGIDRFLFGYVVDFLDFRLINFPVFNLADVFINLGILTMLYLTFYPSS